MEPEPLAPTPRPLFPRGTTVLLALAGGTVAAFGIASIRGIFNPMFLALVLTICVSPVRHWMHRRGIPRGLATGSTIVVVFGLLAGFVAVLLGALAQFGSLLPQFAPQIQQLGANISSGLERLGFGSQQVEAVLSGFDPGRIVNFLGGLLGNITDIVAALVIILTLLILMGMEGSQTSALLKLLNHHHPHMVAAFNIYGASVRRYMVATTVLGIVQGLFNWITLLILQVPGALLWGLLSFICSFIPNIGYFIAIIPPLFFGFLTGGWPTVIAVIVIYGVVNSVIQSVIQPKYVGNAVALSETLTFVSVLFWAVVLGPMGAILAVPLTLLVRTIILDSDPSMAWWRPITGDRTELVPILKEEDEQIRARRRRARRASPPLPGSVPGV
ncbi:AI-2E family transporter [Arthrobacter sp. I2-34]|uniref:AI-2E family transporter n=1 Tax=Arthrobacter hankyongi TaxID=2904801 RepID=A0ABS9LC84_9MICC|nr:AI-2E family transporter [Arthrobacter hankyongi]MCG2624074.1 AI-2E family transporter [Arthrobacter hankyongi]